MSSRPPGSRLQATYGKAPRFWTPTQVAAFEAACEKAGVEPSRRKARQWKHQEGKPFHTWRQISRLRRKKMIEERA